MRLRTVALDVLGTDPRKVDADIICRTCVNERFGNALVRVLMFGVFPAHGYGNPSGRVFHTLDKLPPLPQIWSRAGKVELLEDDFVHLLLGKHNRDLVDRRDIPPIDDGFCFHIGEESDLFPHFLATTDGRTGR